ncbi:SRPBCC domain-containing protein [Micromonospora sp. WMMD1128]|uniref:SRPBCC domain-containing protein n=1 Tax=unclassified Micromonospora TaxID=2617518 RepID=UPI00248C27D2|nr:MULTISPECIES: SRPBCC domain-containing protein [unclassified Micromonospora]WBB76676.1 SRPBCC domain-containing protein [Micromonospora sp. WMMD1128]WFE35532.1 SRPBCC domain-containing protein [Micromonospora sp. WMMD975]
MIEIVTEVDLSHPSARIWQALTERSLLAKWFAESTSEDDRWVLATAGLSGYQADTEVEVVELRVAQRLVVRCREAGRATRLACDLVPTAHGTRLSVREVLEEGDWDAEARAAQHGQAVTGRLPAILDWLAFQEVDLRRAEGGLTAELPVVRLSGDKRRRSRRRVLLAVATVVLLGAATAAALWANRDTPAASEAPPPSPPPLVLPSTTASASPRPTTARPTPSASRRSASPSPSASPSTSRTPSPTPPAALPLAATYQTVTDRVFGYRGEVVLRNPGQVPRPEWTVTVTIGDNATVGSVEGAEAAQDGTVVTFTGAELPPDGSVTIRFDIRDPDPLHNAPAACATDNTPCATP